MGKSDERTRFELGWAMWATRASGLVAMLALGALACSGEDDPTDPVGGAGAGQGGAGGAAQGGAGSGGVDPRCAALVDGNNTGFVVDGEERSFILSLPDAVETGGPWPVVFNWHGLGGSAVNMVAMIAPLVNEPTFSFIGVTPEDTDLMIMGFSVDWDTFQVDPTTNKEARLFDEVLACLDARFGVDTDRVHSVGFSLGAIVTDMLGVTRGDQLASTATYSGAYFSNPENVAALGMLSSQVDWPAPTHGHSYPQMLMHGGTTDSYPLGITTLQFDQCAASDQTYLNGMGHDVVLCDHGGGHSAPATGMMPAQVVQFFSDHPRGTAPSPYAGGLPAGFSAACQLHPAGG